MKMPEISVLLPVYNPDIKKLKLAVDSMLKQSMTDFELLIYDDGSEQKYKDDIRKISKCDPRIRLIENEEHHSLAYGLNTSIKLAKGKYIARMDADDISMPTRLEKEYEFLEQNISFDFVGTNISLIDNVGKKFGRRIYPRIPRRDDFLKYQPYVHPSLMFRRNVFHSEKPYGDDLKDRRGEDYEMLMELTSNGACGYNIQEELLQYRETPNSYKKRKFSYSIQEMIIRSRGFKKLGFKKIEVLNYIIKPIVVWMIPNRLAFKIRNRI